ncbi:DUF4403 family protein [Flavobacterium rhizosphaerae]|uniref:DUF4403 family protein n=1 Tax=Flavobacterium rhizosphaerae TaxID=3163298 RepID=A0ABW8YSH6_9FLAO
MKKTLYLICLMAAVLAASCSSAKKIEALKPEPGNTTDVAYQASTSFINVPVSLALADVQNQLNKLMDGLIYEDKNIDDDNITLKVWKTAPIKFTEENGKLQTSIPLKINGKVKYGTSAMGFDLYDTREFDLDAVITFSSKISLTNWKLNTKTSFDALKWNETPTVTVAGKKVAITFLIDPALKYFKPTIEKEVDNAIKETVDFKPQVLDALQQISTPFLANEEYNTWFTLTPVELYATDATLSKKQITMQMGLKCTLETAVGHKPKPAFKKESVVLKTVATMPDKVNVVVAGVSTFENASKIITENFKGHEFGSGNKKIVVQNVALWSKDGKMIVALDLNGSINGTIYLSGTPAYDTVTKEIYFDQLDYVLNTKGVLMKTANWLAEGYILKKIKENCRYSIKQNLEEGRKEMQPYLNNYSPVNGVFINGTLNDFEFDKIALTNNAIVAFIKATGKIDIKIDGVK